MALSRDLALTPEQQDEILGSQWNMRISTVSPSGRINSTPLWFAWHAGKIWAYCRGQKVDNMRRDPRCTVLVDRNEQFLELQEKLAAPVTPPSSVPPPSPLPPEPVVQ